MHTPCSDQSLHYPLGKTFSDTDMDAVLISTKGQIVLPIAVRRALGLKPGMRVKVSLDGKRAVLTAAPTRQTTQLHDIQALLAYDGKAVPVSAMRVTDYKA